MDNSKEQDIYSLYSKLLQVRNLMKYENNEKQIEVLSKEAELIYKKYF